MTYYKQLSGVLIFMSGMLGLNVVASAGCIEQCEQPLTCPLTPQECQTHSGPATLSMNSRNSQSFLTFDQAFVNGNDLGDPTVVGGTDYRVCIYQGGSLLIEWGAPAGPGYQFINGKSPRGVRFNAMSNPDGMRSLLARPDTSSEVALRSRKKSKGPNGRLTSTSFIAPELPLDGESNFTGMFLNSNTCWSTIFTPSDIIHSTPDNFRMKHSKKSEDPT